jgi:DNA recombination protein RmuC
MPFDFSLPLLFVGVACVSVILFGLVCYLIVRVGTVRRRVEDLSATSENLGQILLGLLPTLREESRAGRDELRQILSAHQTLLEVRLTGFGQAQSEQLNAIRREASEGRSALEQALKRNSDTFSETQTRRLTETNDAMKGLADRLEKAQEAVGTVQNEQLSSIRLEAIEDRKALESTMSRNAETFLDTQSKRLGETNVAMKELAERLEKAQAASRALQIERLDMVAAQIKQLIESNEQRQEALRETVNGNLEVMRKENEAKLEQMRATVEEKLQGTLETRLGESFKMVSERLEQIHKGLGEMQHLATGVGDLKRVLMNVKTRGAWGEVQLEMLLQDLLTPDQYAKNVQITPESSGIVEFAVRLPGRDENAPLHLPIDAKFPQEDYERLLAAQEAGVLEEVEKAAAALERAVRVQAKTICEKYVHPPHSTDFAIMYLPTEGLFAEVVRRPGLCGEIQSSHRVMLTGPTTLAALLTSLQMGFRTLAIEKRSSEVWQVLGAAKAEFKKYGQVWERLGKQLETAKKTVEEAGRRTRAVERKLRDVETLELAGSDELLLEASLDQDENDETLHSPEELNGELEV